MAFCFSVLLLQVPYLTEERGREMGKEMLAAQDGREGGTLDEGKRARTPARLKGGTSTSALTASGVPSLEPDGKEAMGGDGVRERTKGHGPHARGGKERSARERKPTGANYKKGPSGLSRIK